MKGHSKLPGFQNLRIQLLLLYCDKMSVCMEALIVMNATSCTLFESLNIMILCRITS